MRKSGLHKQISSIFDGVPMPKDNLQLQPDESTPPAVQPESVTDNEPVVDREASLQAADTQSSPPATPNSQPSASSLVKRLSADPSECTSAPSIQAGRPMPLPKSAVTSPRKGPGITAQLKKSLFGANRGGLDARQKKMAVLVGVLSIVFGTVMFISFGGMGGSKAVAAEQSDADTVTASVSAAINPADWKSPPPLPADLRDATMPVPRKVDPESTDTTNTSAGGFVVKGILFSKTNPSAIINNEIYTVGQRVNGVLIKNITKATVEFEANGNHWTQAVER